MTSPGLEPAHPAAALHPLSLITAALTGRRHYNRALRGRPMRPDSSRQPLPSKSIVANKQVVFADRIVGLSIHNGLVRVDLAMFAGTGKGKDDKPAIKLEPTTQLVIPLDAFVAGFGMQEKMIKELAARQQKAREGKGKDKAAKDEAAAPAA